ncbi:MAG: periplasmic heavy metal sensor [Thermodesulfobacteriota bacterium]
MRRNIKGIIVLTIAAVFGLSALAFAGWGGMPGPGMHRGGGPGYHHQGYYGNVSPEERAQFEQQREAFYNETAETRQQLQEKQLTLRAELAKQNPDADRALALQREISALRGEMDQKRLEYDIQDGFASPGYGRGGRGAGPMRGFGARGGGYCRW